MKKILAIIIGLLLIIASIVVLFFLVQKRPVPQKIEISQQQIPEWKLLENQNEWSVQYPPDWQELPVGSESGVITLVGPRECFSKGLCGSITFNSSTETVTKVPNQLKDSHTIRTLIRNNKDKTISITVRQNINDPMAYIYNQIVETFKFND